MGVGAHEFEGPQHGERARAGRVELQAHVVVQPVELHIAFAARDADLAAEGVDALWHEAAAAHAGERRQPRVVPAPHVAAPNQRLQQPQS